MTPGPEIKSGPNWWEASALVTAPSLRLYPDFNTHHCVTFIWQDQFTASQFRINYIKTLTAWFANVALST